MSVNLSARQFEQNNLFAMVKNVLEEADMSPEYLHLELTENLIIKNKDLNVKNDERIKRVGYQNRH